MGSRRQAEGGISQEEVARRLAAYDLRKNTRLAALYPPNQYPHTRRCAVLVPLFFSSPSELHVLLTLRSASLSSHADTVAFPGGVQDPSDLDDTHTALREAHEEVGLLPKDVTVVAHLPPFFVGKQNSVFPVVGFIPHDFQPKLNEHEVARVFSVPLKNFVEKDKVRFVPFRAQGKTLRFPVLAHAVDGVPLVAWGFTCQLCVALARAILGPFRRLQLVISDCPAEEGDGDQRDDEGGDRDDVDDNVFGDAEIVYHWMCKASRLGGRL